MKILIVTYCFGNPQGQALIGAYKRSLRLAVELCDRGHQVVIFCKGREFYHDQLTAVAQSRMRFIDFPYHEATYEAQKQNRRVFLKGISQLEVDLMIVGDVPMAGTLLESTLCALELEIPVILLDNAYFPGFADYFCKFHGPIADSVILSGPSSFFTPQPPSHLCQIPPFIESSPQEVYKILNKPSGWKGNKLITILAYDKKVEKLGVSLLEKLNMPELTAVFVTGDPEGCCLRLQRLSINIRETVRVIKPPPDPVLFGLLELSRLTVGKSAFMQVSESLVLGSPFIGVYYKGYYALDDLPLECQPFVHATSNLEADVDTIMAAQRFLSIEAADMKMVHNGELNASEKAADFIETMPRKTREQNWQECFKCGFTEKHILKALQAQQLAKALTPDRLRCSLLRNLPDYRIYILVCSYFLNGIKQYSRFLGRIYYSRKAAKADIRMAKSSKSARLPLYFSLKDLVIIEEYVGESILPPPIPD